MPSNTSSGTIQSNVSHRLGAIDAHRGFIMIVMAIDHAAALVARQHPGEMWSAPLATPSDPIAFLTRFITHICAPGFFLLMGIGIYFLVQHRRKLDWSENRISKHLVFRGLILLLVQQLIENPAWLIGFSFGGDGPPADSGFMIFTAVITALGLSMIAMAFLRQLPPLLVGILGIGIMIFAQYMLPDISLAKAHYPIWQRILLTPGFTAPLGVGYPLLPWLGVSMLGYAIGAALAQDSKQVYRLSLPIGLGLIALWFLIRWTGGFGNSFPYESGSWMVFMNMVKYPPSLAYLSWTLGLNFLIMWAMSRWADQLNATHPLMVYGRTALFYYILHIWMFALIGAAFPTGSSFGIMYLIWALALAPLYVASKAYGQFKRSTPVSSIWRMF